MLIPYRGCDFQIGHPYPYPCFIEREERKREREREPGFRDGGGESETVEVSSRFRV